MFDFDLIGSDELIGWARIPLGGQFRDLGDTAEAQIQAGLGYTFKEKQEVLEGEFEKVSVTRAQGSVKSYVRIENMPKYRQFGAPVCWHPSHLQLHHSAFVN